MIDPAEIPAQPGVYIVRTEPGHARPLYVGVAARQTLRQRWGRNHLSRRSGNSALRRSLAVHIGLVAEKLRRPARYYPPEVEEQITAFLRRCSVEFRPTQTEDEAHALEAHLIAELDPLLNVARRLRRARSIA